MSVLFRKFGLPQILFAADSGAGASAGGAPSPSSPAGGGGGSTPTSPSSSPAPSSAPSSAPSAPSAAPSGVPSQPSFDFDEIFSDPSSVPPPVPAATPPTPAQPPQSPPVQQAPAVPAAPSAPQQPSAGMSGGQPGFDYLNPLALAGALVENEQAAVDYVAQSMFSLSAADVQAFEADVVGYVPKLLAKAFVRSQQNMLEQMGKLVPHMIQQHMTSMRAGLAGQKEFFARWAPLGLDPGTHSDLVMRLASQYRQLNPHVPKAQMIEALGPIVMMAAGVAPRPGAPQNGGAMHQAARTMNPPAFVPAGGGSAQVPNGPAVGSPIESLMDMMFVSGAEAPGG